LTPMGKPKNDLTDCAHFHRDDDVAGFTYRQVTRLLGALPRVLGGATTELA
jgi:hypothetical protein